MSNSVPQLSPLKVDPSAEGVFFYRRAVDLSSPFRISDTLNLLYTRVLLAGVASIALVRF